MSFNFFPTPVFLAVLLFFSIILISYSTNIYKKESKAQSTGYLLLGVAGICAAIIRAIHEYFKNMDYFVGIIEGILGISLLIGFILIVGVAWKKTKENRQLRNVLVISLITIVLTILILCIVLVFVGLN